MSSRPNFAWIISPCSVTRMRPSTEPGRLRLDGDVGRAAAAADAAAAAVEQRQLHAVAAARLDDQPPAPCRAPRRRRTGRRPWPSPSSRSSLPGGRRCARGTTESRAAGAASSRPARRSSAVSSSGTTRSGARDAALALQQLHGEHVGRHRGHRDDVGAERVRRAAAQSCGTSRGRPAPRATASRSGGTSGRRPRELAHQELLPVLLGPLRVRAQAERAGDRVERGGVPVRVLADVEPRQGQAERGEPAQDVGEPAVGDDGVAGLAQRAIAQAQRLGERPRPRGRRPAGARRRPVRAAPSRRSSSIDSAQRARRQQALAHVAQQRAIGLVRVGADARRAARRCSWPSTARRAADRLRGSRGRRPSSARAGTPAASPRA